MKYFFLLLSLLPLSVSAQFPLQQFMDSVMAHSPRISILQSRMKADVLNAKTGNNLDNPEMSFRYMWPNMPAENDPEIDFTLSQSFDFPTAYLHRSQIVRKEIQNSDLQYRAACHDVLLQATQLAIELCFNDTLLSLQRRQHIMSEEFLAGETTRLREGATSVHQFNEAQRTHVAHHQDVLLLEAEREALLAEFRLVCGFDYLPEMVPLHTIERDVLITKESSFSHWWESVAASSPEMQLVANAVSRAELEVKAARDGWLPSFSIGYEQEFEGPIKKRGVAVGMSIPLWANRGKVKAARMALESAQLEAEDQKLSFYTRLQGLYTKTHSRLQSAGELRTLLNDQKNDDLLLHSFTEGVITRTEYLEGMIGILEVLNNLLDQEKEAALLWAELNSVRY